MPNDDGLTRLPDAMVATLMRALSQVRHNPNDRLLLQPPRDARAPVWHTPKADYDVWYRGQIVGRVWRFIYDEGEAQGYAWHWEMRAPNRKRPWRHALTLHEAMEQFRGTWDATAPDQEIA